MGPSELLRYFARAVESLGIPYRVTGSMATIAYGEPRFTNDIDIIVQMRKDQVDGFCDAFPGPEFLCSRAAVAQAIDQHFQFNILHPESGLKIDVIVAASTPFDMSRFSRGRRVATVENDSAWFATPEDVIIKKLLYFQEGGSDKHLRDIVGVLKVQGASLDRAYIAEWTHRLGLDLEWQTVLTRLPG